MYKKLIKHWTTEKFKFYKKYKNILTSILRRSEYLYYSFKINNNSNNSKYTWSVINNLLNKKKIQSNEELNTPSSEEFNNYCSTIGIELSDQIKTNVCDNNIYTTMTNNYNNTLFFYLHQVLKFRKKLIIQNLNIVMIVQT